MNVDDVPDLGPLIERHLPKPFVAEAVKAVDTAHATYATNEDRREWVVRFLREELHIGEWFARLLVEIAILIVKQRTANA